MAVRRMTAVTSQGCDPGRSARLPHDGS